MKGINKILQIIVLCVSVILFAGCATTMLPILSKHVVTATYNLNIEQQKTVGEPIVKFIDGNVYPGFVSTQDYTPPPVMLINFPTIRKDSKWVGKYKNESGNVICDTEIPGLYRPTEPGNPGTGYSCYVVIGNDNELTEFICGNFSYANEINSPKNLFKPDEDIFVRGSFKQELLYNGRTGTTVRFTYREYKDDFARPAFFQDLTYDLNESKTIGFRGMLIDILEASNSTIRYIVRTEMTK
jgi:hypothetical protein